MCCAVGCSLWPVACGVPLPCACGLGLCAVHRLQRVSNLAALGMYAQCTACQGSKGKTTHLAALGMAAQVKWCVRATSPSTHRPSLRAPCRLKDLVTELKAAEDASAALPAPASALPAANGSVGGPSAPGGSGTGAGVAPPNAFARAMSVQVSGGCCSLLVSLHVGARRLC